MSLTYSQADDLKRLANAAERIAAALEAQNERATRLPGGFHVGDAVTYTASAGYPDGIPGILEGADDADRLILRIDAEQFGQHTLLSWPRDVVAR